MYIFGLKQHLWQQKGWNAILLYAASQKVLWSNQCQGCLQFVDVDFLKKKIA